MQDLKKLSLTRPLKLTQIKIRGGENHTSLIGIQLIFEDGVVESPVFDANPASKIPYETFNMHENTMTSIDVRVSKD